MSGKNPKNIFLYGLVTGIAIFSTIGFFVLLAVNFNGEKFTKDENAVQADANAGQAAGDQVKDAAPAAPTGKVIINDSDRIRGDEDAPVTLVEFSDFQCPYCKKFHPTMQKVMEEYEGRVRWVYRHFPLSFHQTAQASAEASECAGEQGKFWEFADILYANSQSDGTGLNTEDLKKYAGSLGLDTGAFDECLAGGKFTDKVKADMASGQAVGVSGTPGTLIIDEEGNTQLISGALPYEQVKEKIDDALK